MRNFFCEVDLDNLEFNIKKIKENTDKKIIAVVKGDAYGFGIEGITAFLDSYVDAFAVVTMEEALRVKSGKDVLILNPVLSADDIQKLKDNFIVSVDDTCLPEMLKAAGKNVRAHVYVDTGMNRFGVKPEELDSLIKKLNKDYPNVKVSGIYTHLHNTKDRDYTLKQIEKFKDAVKPYSGLEIHLLNSPGFLNYNDVVDFGTAIRIGNIIYGYDAEALGYKKIYSYKAIPVRTYEVKKGEYVGYGNLYRAKENDKVSILDFGNIDNFDCFKNIKHNIFYDILKVIYHHVKGRSGITYNGRDVKIIGKSNMNFTLIKNEGFPDDAVFDIDMNPIYADTSIPKKYRKGDKYVQF